MKRIQVISFSCIAAGVAAIFALCNSLPGLRHDAPVRFKIAWPTYDRAGDPVASAKSCHIELPGLGNDGGYFSLIVNRDFEQRAFSKSYVPQAPLRPGSADLTVSFYDEPDGRGHLVATTTDHVRVLGDGTIESMELGPIASFAPGQTPQAIAITNPEVQVGSSQPIEYVASNGQKPAQLMALWPGPTMIMLASQGQELELGPEDIVIGRRPGVAHVNVVTSGYSSPPLEVIVKSKPGAGGPLRTNDWGKWIAGHLSGLFRRLKSRKI